LHPVRGRVPSSLGPAHILHRGEKRICLAITEPSGGSDVANLTTTAVKTEDGKHYIVNGEKKVRRYA
jgi:alkylation response protein AidB-like acyl-CoA dehydrogenase